MTEPLRDTEELLKTIQSQQSELEQLRAREYPGPRAATSNSRCEKFANRENIERLLLAHRLAVSSIGDASSLSQGLQTCLEIIVEAAGLDSGWIYLFDDAGGMRLIAAVGLSEEFCEQNRYFAATSANAQTVLKGNPLYFAPEIEMVESRGGFAAITAIPFCDNQCVVGCMSVSSRAFFEISREIKAFLESIASSIGVSVACFKAKESWRTLNQALACSVNGIAIRDEHGRLTYVNQAFLKLWGYRNDQEVLGRTADAVWLKPSHVTKVLCDSRKGRSWVGEMIAKRKDGSEFVAHVATGQVTSDDGRVCGTIGCILDISEAKRTAKKVKLLAAALEHSAAGHAILDRAGCILYINKAFVGLLGYSAEEQIGKHFSLWHSSETMKAAQVVMNAFWRDGGFKGDVRHIRRDGLPILLSVQGAAIRDENGEYLQVVGSFTDVTELRKAEKNVRQAERLRAEAERLIAQGQLAAHMAHEINNPLAGIMQSLRLVKVAVPAAHPDAKYVEIIDRELRRIANIVRLTYKLIRPESTDDRALRLQESVSDTILMLRPESEQRLVRVECDVDVPEIVSGISDNSVRQVLFNLTRNAIEASPAGGAVRIAARTNDSRLEITVTDDGLGIPPEVGQMIFEPFFTTKSTQSQGVGLGLWIIKGIVNSLNGEIDYESAPGKGTAFRVLVPFPVSNKGCN